MNYYSFFQTETMRRCGFFLEVFGLTMPDYLQCDIFPESTDTDVCLGNREVADARFRDAMPGNTEIEQSLREFVRISSEQNVFIWILLCVFSCLDPSNDSRSQVCKYYMFGYLPIILFSSQY